MPVPLRLGLVFAIALATPVMQVLAATGEITITDAWVRATVPGQSTAGAFMNLTAASPARLVAASSPLAKVVEIHEMKIDAGMMKMRAVDAVDLPAGRTVALAPGAHHVMMMGIAHPLKEGDTVPLTLTFEDKSGGRRQLDVQARVRGVAAAAQR